MLNFFKNYTSTLAFIFIAYFFYIEIPFYQNLLIKDLNIKFINFNFNTLIIYKIIIISYIILLIPFYTYLEKSQSKARVIINYIIKKTYNLKYKISNNEKISLLGWLVKLFFIPLMILWLTLHITTMLNNIYYSYNDIGFLTSEFYLYFNKHLFWLLLSLILLVDLLFFTLGYLIESSKFKNNIKSVDSTFIGWFVVLICYPPLNTYTTNIIGWYSVNFPFFSNIYIHLFLNISILILMGIYARASISLGLKASNLTNRGIVKKGPYKYIRHPAYISKNLSWWIGGLPLLIGNLYLYQFKDFFIVLFSLIAWTTIYYLRSITEEKHLNKDNDYIKYKKEVKYKFLPKIY